MESDRSNETKKNAEGALFIIEELVRCGIDQFVIAPGFRSAPLALAAASHPSTQVTVHFDERGSAFFAVGYGRATRKPCVWLTTSGTAAANGFPAIVEASMDNVPMICLTADRPPELRDTGANQTIDQVRLYGHYPRWFAELPTPSSKKDESFIHTTIDHAVFQARTGPVHLNCIFREPLLEKSREFDSIPSLVKPTKGLPKTTYATGVKNTTLLEDQLQQKIKDANRGLIVAGRLQTPEEGEGIRALAEHLGWPILADICAPVAASRNLVHFFDLIVRCEPFTLRYSPDVILHFGGPLVSKELQKFLTRSSGRTYALINPSSNRVDPHHVLTDRIQANIPGFCTGLIDTIPTEKPDSNWLDAWVRADETAHHTLSKVMAKELSEPFVVRMLADVLNASNWIMCASSMPIRDLQTFFRKKGIQTPRVFSNRGASGIDGTLATAAGISHEYPGLGVVLIGDLAMLHDVNSLNLLKESNVIIIVINNNGGGIFHMLPIALEQDVFEKVLGTPHHMEFRWAAKQFGIPYTLVNSCDEFDQVWKSAASSQGPSLIEVQSDREKNAELHDNLFNLTHDAIQAALKRMN